MWISTICGIMNKSIQEIRNFTNTPRILHRYTSGADDQMKIRSSLYVIEDAQSAIDYYYNKVFGKSKAEIYLAIYGVLQALFIQQDAINNLSEIFKVFTDKIWKKYPKLKEIRDIRNDSTGHPTNRNNKSFHFISQTSVNKNGFLLLSYKEGKSKTKHVKIKGVIKGQKEIIFKILSAIINKLDQDEKKHKEKFKMEKLEELFPQNLYRYFYNIYEGLENPDNIPFSIMRINEIK